MANATTGINQDVLNQVTRAGLNPNIDQSIFNTANVVTPTLVLPQPTQVNPLQINNQNAPNTSVQNRELTNRFLDLNKQVYDSQGQQVQLQGQAQVQQLNQQYKDAQSRNLRLFGSSGGVDPSESSRNLSFVTDPEARRVETVRNIQNQTLMQLNQVGANYAQNNLQALQTVRQLDFQDRQQGFNEAITRGQETGQQYSVNPETGKVENTGRLTLQGKGFEAELTGNYTDFQGNKTRTLAARQIDSSLISQSLQRALTVSDLTGRMPNFRGIQNPDGQANPNFDFTENTGELTIQRQFDNASLSQAQYNQNLFNTMNNQGLYNSEVQAKQEQLKTSILDNQLTSQKLQMLKDNPQLLNMLNGEQGATALTNFDQAMRDYERNPTQQTAEKLNSAYKQTEAQFGSGAGMYYNITPKTKEVKEKVGSQEIAKVVPTGELEFTHNPGSLSEFGFNGNFSFGDSQNQNAPELQKMQEALKQEFLEGFVNNPNDSTYAVNKLLFSDPKTDNQAVLGLRNLDKNGNPQGYKFVSLDMSKMKAEDKIGLERDVNGAKAKNQDNLADLEKLYNSYTTKGLQVNTLNPSQAIDKIGEFGVLNSDVLGGVPNNRVLAMLMLGGRSASAGIIKKDSTLGEFTTSMSNVSTLFNNIAETAKSRNITIDSGKVLQSIMAGDEEITIGVGDKKVPIKQRNNLSKEDVAIVKSMGDWYNQYKNQGLEGTAQEQLNAILKTVGVSRTEFTMPGSSLSYKDLFNQ